MPGMHSVFFSGTNTAMFQQVCISDLAYPGESKAVQSSTRASPEPGSDPNECPRALYPIAARASPEPDSDPDYNAKSNTDIDTNTGTGTDTDDRQ